MLITYDYILHNYNIYILLCRLSYVKIYVNLFCVIISYIYINSSDSLLRDSDLSGRSRLGPKYFWSFSCDFPVRPELRTTDLERILCKLRSPDKVTVTYLNWKGKIQLTKVPKEFMLPSPQSTINSSRSGIGSSPDPSVFSSCPKGFALTPRPGSELSSMASSRLPSTAKPHLNQQTQTMPPRLLPVLKAQLTVPSKAEGILPEWNLTCGSEILLSTSISYLLPCEHAGS